MAKDKMIKKKLLDFVERRGRATRPEILGELRRIRGIDHLPKFETRGYGCGWFRGSNLKNNQHVNQKDVDPYGMGPGPLLYQAGTDPRYLVPNSELAKAKIVTYYEVRRKRKTKK